VRLLRWRSRLREDVRVSSSHSHRIVMTNRAKAAKADEAVEVIDSPEPEVEGHRDIGAAELKSITEALIFVADEPISAKTIADVVKVDRAAVEKAITELTADYEEGKGGLQLREIAGGWQIATRPEFHEQVRAYLKSKPSAKLSLASLETLAVIAYKQPVTVPEILEIRGVQSPSAIKTLLDKRLIIAKGRKETVGRPMMYGTSKEFLIQFGLKDLSELPSMEDFQDLAGGTE
jgi:segregation and condensation protein B